MAAKKKVAGGPWEVILEHMASQNRMTMEALEATRVDLGSRIDALGQGLTTRIEDLERAHVTTRLQLSQDIAATRSDLGALRAEHAETRSELGVLRAEHAETRSELGVLRAEHAETRSELGVLRAEHAETRSELGVLRAEHAETRSDVGGLRAELFDMRDQLVGRIDSLEQRIDRLDRPGSVH
jgi:chromosome segregation ATPase